VFGDAFAAGRGAGFQFAQTMQQITELVAQQAGCSADDFAVHTIAGAIIGVMISAKFYWVQHADSNLFARLDAALAQLGAGLPR